MKKLSLKKLNLGANDMLQRNQLKTVLGGYGGSGSYECYCKNSDNGAAWFGGVSSCQNCGDWCDNNVPSSSYYTSWICSGPLVQI
ncbi:MAG: hypothetical protein ABJK28_10665 [Algibacter sp.]